MPNGLPGLPSLDAFKSGAVQLKEYLDHNAGMILSAIADVREAVDALDTRAETVWRIDDATADGAGVADITFQGPRPGYCWRIERITTVVPNGTTTIGVIYRGQIAPGFAVHAIADADFATDELGQPIYIPPGVPVIVHLSGAPANQTGITAAFQIVEEMFPE